MSKRSRRAAVIATSFALGLSCFGPYAHANLLDGGLLGGGDDSEGLPLPGVGGLLDGGLLDGGVLGGGVLGGDLVGTVLGGVLGGDLLGADLLGEGVPLVSDVLGGALSGDEGVLALDGIEEVVPDLGILPGLGSINEILESFSDSGSIVPGLQVLDEFGILGILGSM